MDLSILEYVVVEHDTFQRDEEHVGDFLDDGALCSVRALPAVLAEAVRYDLAVVHCLQG